MSLLTINSYQLRGGEQKKMGEVLTKEAFDVSTKYHDSRIWMYILVAISFMAGTYMGAAFGIFI